VPVVGPRFLVEAGFIIAVAVVAGVAKLSTLWIVVVMAIAWLIVAAVEIAVSRRRAPARTEPAAAEAVLQPEPAPAPMVEPLPEPERPRPQIVAVPEPEPEPEPEVVEPEPEPEPEPERVVAFTPRNDEPREWNLWELERLARGDTGDVARDEERSYLLMYLREFAGADGNLPADFDGLVRDAFGDLLHAAAS
jgi:hypothetical protein